MKAEYISIARVEEHEKLIRENGYLRDKVNKLEEEYEKHMKNTIMKNHIIFDLRGQRDRTRKIIDNLYSQIDDMEKKTIKIFLEKLITELEEEY